MKCCLMGGLLWSRRRVSSESLPQASGRLSVKREEVPLGYSTPAAGTTKGRPEEGTSLGSAFFTFEREIIDHASQQWYNDENKSGFDEVMYGYHIGKKNC